MLGPEHRTVKQKGSVEVKYEFPLTAPENPIELHSAWAVESPRAEI